MVFRPLFAKDSGVTVNLLDLDVDTLLKINEYLDIRDYADKKHADDVERQNKLKGGL